MDTPEPFKKERIDLLHDAIRRAGLVALTSWTADGLIARPMPLPPRHLTWPTL